MINERQNDLSAMDIITTKGCIQILQPFLYNPKIEMYQSEVIKKTGVPTTRAIHLLNSLVRAGLLVEKVKAGSKFYSAMDENPVLKQLKILIMVSRLYDLTRGFKNYDIEMFLFGSTAKGEDTENSDIDLLVITGEDRRVINDLIDRLKSILDRDVNPVIYSPLEYASLYNKEKAFYDQIERNKIRVL